MTFHQHNELKLGKESLLLINQTKHELFQSLTLCHFPLIIRLCIKSHLNSLGVEYFCGESIGRVACSSEHTYVGMKHIRNSCL